MTIGNINRDNYQCIFNDIKTRIRDQFIQEFFTNINNNATLDKYCIFKTEFVYEEYLNIMDQKARNEISKFRYSAHKLLVGRGRYQNVERNRRICKNCNMNMVEDEYHFFLACPAYGDLRKIYFKKYYYNDLLYINSKL